MNKRQENTIIKLAQAIIRTRGLKKSSEWPSRLGALSGIANYFRGFSPDPEAVQAAQNRAVGAMGRANIGNIYGKPDTAVVRNARNAALGRMGKANMGLMNKPMNVSNSDIKANTEAAMGSMGKGTAGMLNKPMERNLLSRILFSDESGYKEDATGEMGRAFQNLGIGYRKPAYTQPKTLPTSMANAIGQNLGKGLNLARSVRRPTLPYGPPVPKSISPLYGPPSAGGWV